MAETNNFEKHFAVLIDADNVSNQYIKSILDEVSTLGTATYKRIYGDWTQPSMSSWKGVLLENSITPIQQYGYTTGKNATDSAMIIDAMDILYSGNVDGFCIASSDSDFTKLASRLRESGMFVLGMGEKKTPKPFISACNQFRYLEILSKARTEADAAAETHKALEEIDSLHDIKEALIAIVDELSEDDDWAPLSSVGSTLSKRRPDFDVRNYGFSKLAKLVRSLNVFEVSARKTASSSVKHIYIRNK